MINGLEGIPGSGKSYEAVVYHVLEALKQGRYVVTNLPLIVPMFAAINPEFRMRIELRIRPQPVRGVWDASRITVDEDGNTTGEAFELFSDGHVEDPAPGTRAFGHVWDFYSTKKDAKGRGPLYVIDECHVALPKLGTSKAVVEWFKLHRHYNSDVLLMTQSFRDMCSEIAVLLAILVKVRKADILGRKDSYIRKVHGGYRGAVISTEERKYRPEFFPLYKSHTQGSSVAEAGAQDVAPFIVKFNRLKWVVLAAGGIACAWAFWPAPAKPKPAWLKDAEKLRGKPMPEPKGPAVFGPPVSALPPGALPSSAPTQRQAQAPEPVSDKIAGLARGGGQPEGRPGEVPEPYGLKGLHLTGFVRMGSRVSYAITVSQNGAVVSSLTDSELTRVGYKFVGIGDCVATVQWGERVRTITCDSPSITVASQPQSIVRPPQLQAVAPSPAASATVAAELKADALVATSPADERTGQNIRAMRAGQRSL